MAMGKRQEARQGSARHDRPRSGIPLEFLSNRVPGQPPHYLTAFRDADLAGRRSFVRDIGRSELRRLAIWQLHEVATLATQAPATALPYAELGLEMARRVDEPDMLSWGHSELGNVKRILQMPDAEAFLDQGVALARSPYEQANALQHRAVCGLKPYDEESARVALGYVQRALAISPTGEDRIDSDRGHPMVLVTTALIHCYLGDIDIAQNLYHEVLDTACPRHARRSRRVALVNLASMSINFDQPIEPGLLRRFRRLAKNRAIVKSSLEGALIRWVLIYDEIRSEGYNWNLRRQLLTIRKHLMRNKALDRAAFLTLSIGALDELNKMQGLRFLKSDESQDILKRSGQSEAVSTLLSVTTERQVRTVVRLAEKAGARNIVEISGKASEWSEEKRRNALKVPLEFLSNRVPGQPPHYLTAFRDADLAGRRSFIQDIEKPELRRLAIWQLHEVATLATQNPVTALPYAELGLEMARRVDEPDMLSWGHSELGNVKRLLQMLDAEALLDQGVALARSPYEQANALQHRAVCGLKPYDEESARVALGYVQRALAISPTGEDRIDSDRGHPMVLVTTALIHCYLGQFDTAKDLYREVLDTASPIHASRSRRVALVNLAAMSVNFDQPMEPGLLRKFRSLAKSRAVVKSSLEGALIQCVLIYDEIRSEGYDRNKRRRLLTVRKHLLENRAVDRAAFLTLSIGALDMINGLRGLQLLQSQESQEIFLKGGQQDLLRALLRIDDIPADRRRITQIVVRMAEKAGAGNAHNMKSPP